MPGPGNRQLVAAVPRQAPIYSLLTAATIVPPDPDQAPIESGPLAGIVRGGKWLNGIKYRQEKCGTAGTSPLGCDTDTDEDDIVNVDDLNAAGATYAARDGNEVDTDPFMVWTEDECSSFGWSANDYVGRAQRLLAASEAYAVETEFWTGTQAQAAISAGVAYPDDQWLAQSVSCVTLNSGGPTNIGYGLGLLQAALGDCSGGGAGMIHCPPWMLNALLTLMIVTPVPPNGNTPAQIIDLRGNRIVPGFGYTSNLGPDGNPAGAGYSWMYATGPVRIYRDDPQVYPNTYAQALDRVNNDITFRVERNYLVDWDRCCHFAVLVSSDLAADNPAT